MPGVQPADPIPGLLRPGPGGTAITDPAAAAVWTDPDAPAACLLTLGVDRHPETDPGGRLLCLNWRLDTWADEVRDDCGVDPHPVALARLGAALTLLTSPDEFYTSPAGFADVCQALAGDWFDTDTAHPPTAEELAGGLAEAHLIAPPDPDEAFAPGVVRLVNATLRREGFARLPAVVRAFGVPPDPGVDWGADLSGDPDLAALAAAGADDREAGLAAAVRDRLAAVADYLARLPLRHTDPRAAAAAIRAAVA